MSTLQQVMEAIKPIIAKKNVKKQIASQLLGKFKDIIPERKTSTEFIRELRQTLYGKIS